MNKKLHILKEQQSSIFEKMSEIIAGMSSPVRVKLIHFLSQGPLTVEVLANKVDQSIANTSMHLRKMLASNLVDVSVQAQKRLYTLHPAVHSYWEACQNLTQEINPNLSINSKEIYGAIDWDENLKNTLKMVKNNEAILLDVRPSDEVIDSIKELNVINITISYIFNHLHKLNKNKIILVFCRGRFCALSSFAVNELRESGFKAYRLNESWYAIKNNLKR